jgi:hypothetical protein
MANNRHSLAWNVEDCILQLLAGEPGLSGIKRRHHDDKQPAAVETIVAEAVIGQRMLDGVRANAVEVRVSFGTARFPAAMADQVATLIQDSVHNPRIQPKVPELEFLSIESEGSGITSEDGKKVRKRKVVIPVLAKLRT